MLGIYDRLKKVRRKWVKWVGGTGRGEGGRGRGGEEHDRRSDRNTEERDADADDKA